MTNTGERAGADVPQLYLTDAAGERRACACSASSASSSQPGESRRVTVTADPRLLARFDGNASRWVTADGEHDIAVGTSAETPVLTGSVALTGRSFGH